MNIHCPMNAYNQAAGFVRDMGYQGSQSRVGPAFTAPGDVQVISMDFREVLAGIWRRRLAIVLTGVVFALLAYGIASLSSPRYTTSAQVLVDNLETPFNRAQPNEAASGQRQIDPADVQSQVEVLQSRDIAKRVIKDLRLTENAEFNPSTKGLSLFKRIRIALGFSADPRKQTPEQRALAAYYSKTDVYQIPSSKVIVIVASSGDPRMAAALANATADTYVQTTREFQSQSTGRARSWLSEQIASLRKKVAESEAAVEAFRTKAGLLKGQSTATLTGQQLSELSSQIVLAESQRSEAQVKARSIRALLKHTGTVDNSIDVLNSALIQRLREQQIALKRRLAELSTVYLNNHPKIIGVKSELADLDRQLRAEALKVVQSLEQQAKVAATRENALRASLARLKSQASVDNQDEVKLRALEREAAANRTLLETFLGRYSDASTRVQLDAQPGLARVIARADPPAQPSYPKVGPIVTIGLVGGLLLGLGFAFMAEVMSTANRVFAPAGRADAGQLTATPPPPSLEAQGEEAPSRSAAPLSPGVRLAGFAVANAEQTTSELRSAREAALRPVASWLMSQRNTLGVKCYALVCHGGTDAVAAEAVVRLARLCAGEGIKVLVVDANTVKRPLAALFEIGKAKGLVELLSGNAAFSDVIVRDAHSEVHVLPAGLADAGATVPLTGRRIDMVLEALEHTYDVVLLNVGVITRSELAGHGLLAKCQGAVLFAPAALAQEAGVILEHLRRLGARTTRLVKVGGPKPETDKAGSARMAVNA